LAAFAENIPLRQHAVGLGFDDAITFGPELEIGGAVLREIDLAAFAVGAEELSRMIGPGQGYGVDMTGSQIIGDGLVVIVLLLFSDCGDAPGIAI
jgi:hypothetical protein